MTNALEIVALMLAALLVAVALTNVTIYPIYKVEKLCLYAYVFISYFVTYKINQNLMQTVIFSLIIPLFIILLMKRNVYSVSSAIVGYLTMVCLNYVVLIILNLAGITGREVEDNLIGAIVFNFFFCALTYVITYFLGKYLRYLVLRKYCSFFAKKKVKYFIFLNLLGCFFTYISCIVLGRKVGYSPEIIKQNGIILITIFIGTCIVFTAEIIYVYNKYVKLALYRIAMENNKIKEIKTRQHGYNNVLNSLHEFVKEKKYEELREYFYTILPQQKIPENIIVNSFDRIKIIPLRGC